MPLLRLVLRGWFGLAAVVLLIRCSAGAAIAVLATCAFPSARIRTSLRCIPDAAWQRLSNPFREGGLA
jgi:hypothetical protein